MGQKLSLGFSLALVALGLAGACGSSDNGTADASVEDASAADGPLAEVDASSALEGEICPVDGSFEHLAGGSCGDSDDPGDASPCLASMLCAAAHHCVGQGGGEGAPDECRTVNCGTIDCGGGCTCAAASLCLC